MIAPINLNKKPRSKVAARKLQMREKLWPAVDPKFLWNRSDRVGFVTIPRVMPLLMGIMDDMTDGRPVSSSYLDLWCHSYDDSFVIVTKPREHAFSAGFTGQRAEGTWTARMRLLADLKFIEIKPGPSGPINYVLIWNPFVILKYHRAEHTSGLREENWNALEQRMIEVGADDLNETEAAST